jgi:hypothetical protein
MATTEYQALSERLDRVTRIELVGGATYDSRRRKNNDQLAVCVDPDVVAKAVLAIEFTDKRRMDWMTPGGPTLAFLDGRQLVVAVVCVLPGYVRGEGIWDGDAELVDPEGLAALVDELMASQ